jgi:hypothetical protein
VKEIQSLESPIKKQSISVPRRDSIRAVPLNNTKTTFKRQRVTVNNIEDTEQKKKEKLVFSSHKQISREQTA